MHDLRPRVIPSSAILDDLLIWGFIFLNFIAFFIPHSFICRPLDSTVSEDAGIERRTVATLALAVRLSNHSTRSHPQSARSNPRMVDAILDDLLTLQLSIHL